MFKKISDNIKRWKDFKTAEDYYNVKDQRLLPLIISTNKLKDVYHSKEAAVSFILATIFTAITGLIIKFSVTNISDKLLDLLGIQIGAQIGLLGFLIGGAALLTGSISIDMIKKIDISKAFHQLLALLVPFYLLGVILGVSLLISIFTYLVILIELPFNIGLTAFLSFINYYFLFFSLISSIMLLGTCIRIFILRYKLESVVIKNNKDEKE